ARASNSRSATAASVALGSAVIIRESRCPGLPRPNVQLLPRAGYPMASGRMVCPPCEDESAELPRVPSHIRLDCQSVGLISAARGAAARLGPSPRPLSPPPAGGSHLGRAHHAPLPR